MINKPALTGADKAFDLRMLQASDKLGRGLLGDVCDTTYAMNGSVWHYGLGGAKQATPEASKMGMFTNDYGDSITVIWDHTPQYHQLTKTLAGSSPYYDWLWFFQGTRTAYNLRSDSEARDRYNEAKAICKLSRLIDRIDMRTNGTGWAEEAAEAFSKKITWLMQSIADVHKIDKSPKRILVVLHRESPYNIKEIAQDSLKFLEVAASIVLVAVPAIPKDVVSSATKVLQSFVETGKVQVDDLVKAALSIAPDSLRKNEYVTKATNVYNKVQSGNYLGAAKEVGIDVGGMLSSFQKTCDWTDIVKTTKLPFDTTVSSLQNYLNADVVSKFAGKLRSGELVKNLIETGSITSFKEFQDAILGGINPQTIMTLLPNPPELVRTMIHETNNLRDNDVFRAFIGLANGVGVGDNVLDSISVEAISSRVNSILAERLQAGRKDIEYALTTAIDQEKREYFAQEVSKNTGAKVLTNVKGLNVSSNLRKAIPYVAIGTAVAGVGYYYNRSRT